MNDHFVLAAISMIVGGHLARKARLRLKLSRAKHPSLNGHSKWSRRIARLIPFFEYTGHSFFSSDGAPKEIAGQRRAGFQRLANLLAESSPKTNAFGDSLKESMSDVCFTNAYRVPFPYRNFVQNSIKIGQVVEESSGVMIKNLDGVWDYDLSGSYGVNVFGYEFYKGCLKAGFEKVQNLGPVLGPYHPLIRDNVEKLKDISGLDEVSFHMSGTEAVMQAVRLARYHTGRSHLVRLCGAYHGWWDGVQPGIGNQRQSSDTYTLRDLSENTLEVLNSRNDIACVLINPMQAFHPNSDAPGDAKLINSERHTCFDRDLYARWLQRIQEICTTRSIVLIFDEVFTGFRLAYRGAQEYFGVQADIVCYGKTLGGGLPVGVVCGKRQYMKRFKDDQPVNISYARGTFNSHPCVMATMNEFLNRIKEFEYQQLYQNCEAIWNDRGKRLNQQLSELALPVRVENLSSVFSVVYTRPSRYNWMFQFYLRVQGIALSWTGTGRMIMSFDFKDDDFNQVIERIKKAAVQMERDGWWWRSPELTNRTIKRQMLKAMICTRFPALAKLHFDNIEDLYCQNSTDEV